MDLGFDMQYMQRIKETMKNGISTMGEINPIDDFNYKEEAKKYEEELSEITKLQDSLPVLNKINASMELVLLVKKRLKSLTDKKNNLF